MWHGISCFLCDDGNFVGPAFGDSFVFLQSVFSKDCSNLKGDNFSYFTMMFVRAGFIAVLTVAIPTSQEGNLDSSVLLQTNRIGKQNLDKVTSQINRALAAIGKDTNDKTICVEAEEGDEAPAEGTFLAEADSSAVAVQQGFVAPVAGKYCIEQQTLAKTVLQTVQALRRH